MSLLIRLDQNDAGKALAGRIESYFRDKLPLQTEMYWETTSDTGLHVTLYEFSNRESVGHQEEASRSMDEVKKKLGDLHSISSDFLFLGGAEIMGSALVVRAFLSSDFIGRIRQCCHHAGREIGHFNVRRVPFPLHCTVVRFCAQFTQEGQEQLRAFAHDLRRYDFGRMPIGSVSLQMVSEAPYNSIVRRANFELQPKVRTVAPSSSG